MHAIARNIAALTHALHTSNYTVGAFNPDNFFAQPNGMVLWFSLDSIQAHSPERTYPCTPPISAFLSPEACRSETLPIPKTHDFFALPTLLHWILLGYHPFTHTNHTSLKECILNGNWIANTSPSPKLIPPHATLHPPILEGFHKVFSSPDTAHRRPKASWWSETSAQALIDMEICSNHPNHFFLPNSRSCPWCLSKKNANFDPFNHSNPIPLHSFLSALDSADWIKSSRLLEQNEALHNIPLNERRHALLLHSQKLQQAYIFFKEEAQNLTAHNTEKAWTEYAQEHDICQKLAPRFPFIDLLPAHTQHQKDIEDLQKLCARLDMEGQMDPYVCEQIIKACNTLKAKGALPHLLPKTSHQIERAHHTTTLWKKLLTAVHTHNDVELTKLHIQEHKALASIHMPPSYRQALNLAANHHQAFHHINSLLKEEALHASIHAYLQSNRSLLNSSFCSEELSNGMQLGAFDELLTRKDQVTPQITHAVENADYLTIHRLWDNLFYEPSHPWKTASLYAKKGKNIAQKWTPVRRAIMEKDLTFLRAHWDEKLFASAVHHEEIHHPTQEAIRLMYKGASFPQSDHWPLAYIQADHLHVVFPWPTCEPKISHCLIAWNTKHHPRSVTDLAQNDIAICATQPDLPTAHICFQCPYDSVFISIWPAAVIAQQIIPVATPLQTQTQKNTYAFYRTFAQSQKSYMRVSSPFPLSDITLFIVQNSDSPSPIILQEVSLPSLKENTPFNIELSTQENPSSLALLGCYNYGEPLSIFKEISW